MTTEYERAADRLAYIDAALAIRESMDDFLSALDSASDEASLELAIASVLSCDPQTAKSLRWLQMDSLTARQQDRFRSEREDLALFLSKYDSRT